MNSRKKELKSSFVDLEFLKDQMTVRNLNLMRENILLTFTKCNVLKIYVFSEGGATRIPHNGSYWIPNFT